MKRKLLISLLIVLFSACSFNTIKGDGNIVEKNIDSVNLEKITEISASGAFDIVVNIASSSSLKVITDKNLLKYIQLKISGNKLKISSTENIDPSDEVKIILTLPHLTYVDLSGANDLSINNLNEKNFSVDCSGSSSILLNGKVENFSADISGSADLNSLKLKAKNVTLDISGAGDAKVYADGVLRVSASGAADVEYAGNPELVNSDISGAGSVEKYYEKKKKEK